MEKIDSPTEQPQQRVLDFFADSAGVLDHMILRPLGHIAPNWELTWDAEDRAYRDEDGSLAAALNRLVTEVATSNPPVRYHDHEDGLAVFVRDKMGWPVRKERGRWVGADYDSLLEQGGFSDLDQQALVSAAAGRIHAAISRGQLHFDTMESSHQRMLGAVLAIILYHRSP